MTNKQKELFKPTVVLLVICVVVSFALSLTNMLTKDKIAELAVKAEQDALASVMPDCDYKQAETDGTSYYIAEKDGEVAGYIFTGTEKGYGGDIKVMTAVKDGTVLGIAVVDVSSETTGLGQKAADSEFYSQYMGKTAGIGVSKNTPKENEVKAITGATITTKAVTEIVNNALGLAEKIEGGATDGE